MSYDIRFGVKVAGAPEDCFAVIGNPERDSPTYNLREMFVKSMNWDYDQGEWYPIKEVLPKVKRGIAALEQHPDEFKAYEPKNGWGTMVGAIECLQSIVDYFDPEKWDGLAGSWNADIPIDCIYMRW